MFLSFLSPSFSLSLFFSFPKDISKCSRRGWTGLRSFLENSHSRSSLESRRRKKRIISGASFDHVPIGIFHSFFFPFSLPSLFFFSNKDSSKGTSRTTLEYVIQLSCWIILISLSVAQVSSNYHLDEDEWMDHSSIFFILQISFLSLLSVF